MGEIGDGGWGMEEGRMLTEPGIYEISMAEYHADPCEVPSLSSSIAKLIVRRTPKHAWQAHARFGAAGLEPSRVMDDGSTEHAMLLGQEHLIQEISTVYGPKTKRKDLIGLPVKTYQSDAAQEERDEIRDAGKIPVLHHRLAELLACKEAALEQIKLAADGPAFLAPGRNEITAVAREADVWLRCLVDRLPDNRRLPPIDLKCTEMSAAPGDWERRLRSEYAFQDAFYRRVLRGAEGVERPAMRFGVIELDPPHGVVFNAADTILRSIAEAEVERAIQRWRMCMTTGIWRCYPPHTAWVEAKSYQIEEAEDAAAREDFSDARDPHAAAKIAFA
jgi:hypothetical protein